MTRLQSSQLANLGRRLEIYDRELEMRTGRTLRQIACRAAEIQEEFFVEAIRDMRVGVVSTTIGQGILAGFGEAVRDIVRYLGCEVFMPKSVDVAGLAAAIREDASVVYLADDSCFVAINFSTGTSVDNREATGRGFAAALEGWVGGLQDRRVLVIGAGEVGKRAAKALLKMGARLGVYDRKEPRAKKLARELKGTFEEELERALQHFTFVFDATPAGGFIEARHIRPDTVIAAPGIPLGVSPEALARIGKRLIHDPLQIGVATMMALAVKRTAGHAD